MNRVDSRDARTVRFAKWAPGGALAVEGVLVGEYRGTQPGGKCDIGQACLCFGYRFARIRRCMQLVATSLGSCRDGDI